MYVIFRILLGCFFIVSGFEKLITPYQNFLYVVQNYELFPDVLEIGVAHTVPWIELFLGLFLVLGLWLRYVFMGQLVLISCFILIIGQALIRNLPITECGCLGELISFPLQVTILIDSALLLLTVFLFRNLSKSQQYSLDKYFEQ